MSDAPIYSKRKLIMALIIVAAIFATLIELNVSMYTQNAVLQTDKTYLQSQISSLENDKSNLMIDKSYLQEQFRELQKNYDDLSWWKDYYESIATFNESDNILPLQSRTVSPPGAGFIFTDQIQFAGYYDVSLNSTSNATYVWIAYSSIAGDFSLKKTFGFAGREIFFVLPTPELTFFVGNDDQALRGTIMNYTVSVTYDY